MASGEQGGDARPEDAPSAGVDDALEAPVSLFDIVAAGPEAVGEDGYVYAALRLSEVHESTGAVDAAISVLGDLRVAAHRLGHSAGELWATVKLLAINIENKQPDAALRYAIALRPLLRDLRATDSQSLPAPDPSLVRDALLALCSLLYYEAEDYDGTFQVAQLALEVDANFTPVLLFIGYIQLQRDQPDAVMTWRTIAAAIPDAPFAHTNLAFALAQTGDLDAAVDAIDVSIRLEPNDPLTWNARAAYNRARGADEEALRDYEAIIHMDVNEETAGDQDADTFRSVAEYRRDMPLGDRADAAAIARISLLRDMRRGAEAMESARLLLETGDIPTACAAAELLSDILAADGRHTEAIRTLDRAISRSGEDGGSLFLRRAQLHVLEDDISAALSDLDVLAETEAGATAAMPLLLELAERSSVPAGLNRVLGHAHLTSWQPAKAHARLVRAEEEGPLDAWALYWRALSTITFGATDDPAEVSWAESLSRGRIRDCVIDLAVAHSMDPDETIAEALRWVIDRAALMPDVFAWLALSTNLSDFPLHSWDGLELLVELWRGADLGTHRQWSEGVEALTAVRERLRDAGLPLLAANSDVLAADSLLRLYSLQQVEDRLAAAEAAMREFSTPLDAGIREEGVRRVEMGDREGILQVVIDFDHLWFVMACQNEFQKSIAPLRAQLAIRTGDRDEADALLKGEIEVDELVTSYKEGRSGLGLTASRATHLRDVGRLDDALTLADAMSDDPYDVEANLTGLNIAATVLMSQGRLDEAVGRLEKGLQLGVHHEPDRLQPLTGNLASIYLAQHDWRLALNTLDANPPGMNAQHVNVFTHQVMRGQALLELKHNEEALKELLAAADLHEKVRGTLRSVDSRMSWQHHADRVSLYEKAIIAAIYSKDFATVFALIERSKARSFLDQLATGRLPDDSQTDEWERQLARVRARLGILQSLASETGGFVDHEAVRQLLDLGGDDPRVAGEDGSTHLDASALKRDIDRHGASVTRIQNDIDKKRLSLVDGVVGDTAALRDLDAMLVREAGSAGRHVILVEFYVTADWTLLFMMTSGQKVEAAIVEIDEERLHELADVAATGFAGATPAQLEEWHRVLAPFVEPIADFCDPGDLVWLVPFGPLHAVPLHAVEVGGRPFIERNPIVYSPSASVMPYCIARRSPRTDQAVVVGDSRGDLIHARQEARRVAALLGTEAYLAADAQKSAVVDRLGGQDPIDIVHLACHGVFNAEEPFHSGILMASTVAKGGSGEDSILTARDLSETELQARLVTLSACQSGVDASRAPEEFIGLTRAILYAGSAAVLVSLWMVDDYSTALFMEEFYQRLLSKPLGESAWAKAEAVREAQLAVMSMTAEQVAARLRDRLQEAGGEPATEAALTLDLVAAYVAAGDLDGAIQQCEALMHATPLAESALAAQGLAESLRFTRAVQDRSGNDRDIDWGAAIFDHPSQWAGFVLVGDWA